jgi:LysM repeat protein
MISKALAFTLSVSALALSGCITSQENPNYQHSTRYQGADPTTPVFEDTMPMEATTVSYEPVVYEQAPAAVITSTDATYTDTDVVGTPGFMAMQAANAEPAPVITTASTTSTGAVEIDYDYTPNLVAVDTQMPATLPEITRSYGTSTHVVAPGDTVYSLARKTCTSLTDITAPNAIGADYGIKIGQVIQLPASRC